MTRADNFFTFPEMPQIETVAILKQLSQTHRALAELKGIAQSIPNPAILLNTLSLQEAQSSSEIESIITTHDALFKSNLDITIDPIAKEVSRYHEALIYGFAQLTKTGGLTLNHIKEIYKILEENDAEFRKIPGTTLKDSQTDKVIYTPPQEAHIIEQQMAVLEKFINDENVDFKETDPLIKMAIIHLLFESTHPFYDGNGRIGRIINILYLVLHQLLDKPILYLSGYIVRHKEEYYRLLQKTRETHEWEEWVIYMLKAIEQSSRKAISLIHNITALFNQYEIRIKDELPKIYSQDLLNNLFKQPYTKIDFLMKDINKSRQTTTKYLDELVDKNILMKFKLGKHNYYVNKNLLAIIMTHNE